MLQKTPKPDTHMSAQEQITWPDFQAQLRNPHMQQLFAALDVDEAGLTNLAASGCEKVPLLSWLLWHLRRKTHRSSFICSTPLMMASFNPTTSSTAACGWMVRPRRSTWQPSSRKAAKSTARSLSMPRSVIKRVFLHFARYDWPAAPTRLLSIQGQVCQPDSLLACAHY